MATICPTVTAYTVDDFHDQMNVVAGCGAGRVHIDLTDDLFASPKTITMKDVWWPQDMEADVHLMYEYVHDALPGLVAMMPAMVVIHAESPDNLVSVVTHLKNHDIAVGLALLQTTTVDSVTELVKLSDHVLVFSGNLGSFGGSADLSLLGKVAELKALKPTLEIGWDGGINTENARQLADGGVDVLNVGGAIHHANRPENAFRDLQRRLAD